MAAFFRSDARAASNRIRDILATDKGDPNQLIGGLVNRLAANLHMLSGLLGSSPEQLLNTDWTDDDLEELSRRARGTKHDSSWRPCSTAEPVTGPPG